MSLSVEVAGKSDVGCVRQNNEDNFGFDSRCGIYVVCDGMGGQAAGEVASKIAVDTVLDYFRQAHNRGSYPRGGVPVAGLSERAQALGGAIRSANAAIHQAAAQHAVHSGMGCTIVAALVDNDSVSIGHVGDSRLYRVRQGAIEQLTRDHSLVMEQVRRGVLTPQQAQRSEMQNIILRALGPEEHVEVDLEDMTAQAGDLLLLCSDGLTRHVADATILELAQGPLSPMAGRLIDAARAGGGSDNITVLLLRFQQLPWHKKLFGGDTAQSQDSF